MSFWLQLRKSFIAMVFLSVLLGLLYPLFVTGVGRLFFEDQVRGSLVQNTHGQVIGSSLIGQNFQDPKYFFSRPSAATPAYNALTSGGSNWSPTNPQLLASLKTRAAWLQKEDPNQTQLIPIDLITASGSGLDPDISVASAYYQAPRIAALRNLPLATVNTLIATHITPRQFGLFGEPRVNVLNLNQALDAL